MCRYQRFVLADIAQHTVQLAGTSHANQVPTLLSCAHGKGEYAPGTKFHTGPHYTLLARNRNLIPGATTLPNGPSPAQVADRTLNAYRSIWIGALEHKTGS
jgi:hypothetical protein